MTDYSNKPPIEPRKKEVHEALNELLIGFLFMLSAFLILWYLFPKFFIPFLVKQSLISNPSHIQLWFILIVVVPVASSISIVMEPLFKLKNLTLTSTSEVSVAEDIELKKNFGLFLRDFKSEKDWRRFHTTVSPAGAGVVVSIADDYRSMLEELLLKDVATMLPIYCFAHPEDYTGQIVAKRVDYIGDPKWFDYFQEYVNATMFVVAVLENPSLSIEKELRYLETSDYSHKVALFYSKSLAKDSESLAMRIGINVKAFPLCLSFQIKHNHNTKTVIDIEDGRGAQQLAEFIAALSEQYTHDQSAQE